MKKLKCILFSIALTVTFSGSLVAQSTAYTGARLLTMGNQGEVGNGTLVVKGDKIVAAGKDVEIPADARIVPMNGKTIFPGIVDPYFVYSQSSSSTTRTIVFRGRRITVGGSGRFTPGAFVQVGEYFYPYKFNFKPALRSGVTVANLVSDGRGQSSFANLTDTPSPEMLFKKDGVLFAKVTNQTSALDIIRKPLAPAKKSTTRTSSRSTSSKTDKTKELWQAVKDGKAPLFVNMNNAASVAYILKFLNESDANKKIKIVFVATGGNLFQSIDSIAQLKNVSVVLQPSIDRMPYRFNYINVAKMLADKKIPFAISLSLQNSQLQTMQDDPFFPLAMLVKTGLSRQSTLAAITTQPAEMMGLEKTHGSLEKNKQANFLVFDGDPLATGSRLEQTFLNGKVIHENK